MRKKEKESTIPLKNELILTNKKAIAITKLLITNFPTLYQVVKKSVRKPIYYSDETPRLDKDGRQITVFDSDNIQEILIVAFRELSESTVIKLISILIDIPEEQVMDDDFAKTITMIADFVSNKKNKKALLSIVKMMESIIEISKTNNKIDNN